MEYREGDYRYTAPAGAPAPTGTPAPAPQAPAAQPPVVQGEHPYAAFSAAGYGDDGYLDPGYNGPAAQDAGYRGHGYPDTAAPASRHGQPGYPAAGYGGGEIEPAYPAPGQHQGPGHYETAEPRWQAWDYDQPLRYEDDDRGYPARDGYGRDDYRGADGYAPDGYQPAPAYDSGPAYDSAPAYGSGPAYDSAPVYDPAEYNGSGYSRPGIDGPGYDLSGIIGTGDFEAFGYDEPGYDRLSYDDPRYDDRYDGGPGAGRVSDTSLDMFGGARFDETRYDMPRLDETRLDRLWLSDEDVRHDDAVGYENDGFGDSRIGPGYPDGGAPRGARLDETRLDLMRADPRMDHTRFDVPAIPAALAAPAFDETRIDSMRALGPRPAAAGLLAPPDERQFDWAQQTSFDDFGDGLEVLDDEPVRAPAAFVRTAERQDGADTDTAARRAAGRRRGRSGDRRQWMALGAIAVVAAGAIGGVLMKYVFSGPSGPAHTVAAPNQVDGFTRMPNLEKQMKLDALRESVTKDSSGQASNLASAVYQQGNAVSGTSPQIFMFVGGNLAGASPSASVASFTQDYPGAKVVPAGSLGGDAVCAQRQLNGESVAMCVWFDNDSFGALVSPTMTTAKLATTLDEVRPSLEHVAK